MLPIIDLSYLTANFSMVDTASKVFSEDPNILKLVDDVSKGFSTWGFVYLKGHGISESLISDAFRTSAAFFALNLDEKVKFRWNAKGEMLGYVPCGEEVFERQRPHDIKEAFDWNFGANRNELYGRLPKYFFDSFAKLNEECQKLSVLLLRVLDLVLGLNDAPFFVNQHRYLATNDLTKNYTLVRSLFYPPVAKADDIREEQLRCGEHSDYGTFTLLFQDEAGGLQVVSPDGNYVDVTPMPGCIVANAADHLEIWSSGRLKSTRHRVMFPADISKPRQSIAYFLQADNDVNVKCIDGSDKYEVVNSYEYLMKQLGTYYTNFEQKNSDSVAANGQVE